MAPSFRAPGLRLGNLICSVGEAALDDTIEAREEPPKDVTALSFRFPGTDVRKGRSTEGGRVNEENVDACDEPPNDILLAPIEELEEFAERLCHL
jgi:hypothetical protein